MALDILLNGKGREFSQLNSPAPLAQVIAALELKADRVAVEVNGELAPRATWPAKQIHAGDRVEIVHFVGGGCSCAASTQPLNLRFHS